MYISVLSVIWFDINRITIIPKAKYNKRLFIVFTENAATKKTMLKKKLLIALIIISSLIKKLRDIKSIMHIMRIL